MNTDLKTTNPNRSLGSTTKSRWLRVVAALVVILISCSFLWTIWLKPSKPEREESVFVVKRGPLRISVTEAGTIKSRDRVVVKSEVEGRTTILWLIQEGKHVQKGDLLLELDASRLEDQKTKQEITVLNANAAHIRARENVAVTKSQTESDIAKAKLVQKFAELDHQKYIKGEYPQQVKERKAQITIARRERTRAKEKRHWSNELEREGYITKTELEADDLDLERRQLNVQLEEGKLKVLQEYTHVRNLEQLESDVEQAAKALDRVELRTSADLVQADTEFKARTSELERQEKILKKTGDQIAKCRIVAPVAGMVIYSTTGRGNWRGNAEPMDEGQEVRERQELIYLPTTASMMAEIKIHESSLRKVSQGMNVVITADALPGKVLSGKVGKIALLPDATMAWLNPDLKVFSTEIYLDGDDSDIRTGMSCQVEIIVEEYAAAVYVPVQTVLRIGNKPNVYVLGPDGVLPREVVLGLDNNRMVRIVSGLQEGEKVLLAPPLSPSEVVNGLSRPPSEVEALQEQSLNAPSPPQQPQDQSKHKPEQRGRVRRGRKPQKEADQNKTDDSGTKK